MDEDENLKCFMHLSSASDAEKLIQFTSRAWGRFLEFVVAWNGHTLTEQGRIASEFVSNGQLISSTILTLPMPGTGGFHRKCYQRFTDVTRLEKATRKRKHNEENLLPCVSENDQCEERTHVYQQKKILRSSSDKINQAARSPHILPEQCIICKGIRYTKTAQASSGRTGSVEQLTVCEQIDGGQLLQAAKLKEDENLLRQVHGQDCVAIEVRYHRSCYKDYTRFLSRKSVPKSSADDFTYMKSFQNFCVDVVEQRLIKNKEIVRLSTLRNVFVNMIDEEEHLDASNYKSWGLKTRLQRKYPQLVFLKPKHQNESDFVYVDEISTDMILTDKATIYSADTTDTDSIDSEHEDAASNPGAKKLLQGVHSTLQERYSCALNLRQMISEICTTTPWPPTSENLSLDEAIKIVPLKLYNMIAWITGVSSEPEDDIFVKLPDDDHRHVLSIAQDIIYMASKGRILTPKHASLSMAIRHLSGSAQLIGLLNGLGHCTSHSAVLEHDTALATNENMHNGKSIPSCLQEGLQTTLVWDNDFGEETLSGRGTTHNTNGIAIQHEQEWKPSHSMKCTVVQEKRKKRSLPVPHNKVLPFFGNKKSEPAKFPKDLNIRKLQYTAQLSKYNLIEFAYYVTKMSESEYQLPSWTGFNQLLTKTIPPKATVAYLPIIDASPTEYSTVNTILQKSIDIADSLELNSIDVVFDQAIYSKAQMIRWQIPQFTERLVIRLGAFHTAMTFMACIGKRYQDAGLQDVLVEAGVIASGSITGVMSGKHYNRSIRCHKVMSEALHRLRWKHFLDMLSHEDAAKNVQIIGRLKDSFPNEDYDELIHSQELTVMKEAYDTFVKERSDSDSTFAFWSSYLSMVENLLLFIRSSREGNWSLHLATVRCIAPWMFGYDRQNYARYLPVYWLEMLNLPTTHPVVHEYYKMGNFSVQRQESHGFAKVPCDMTIEQTANRDSKTRGGITGFSTKKGAVSRWTAAFHERAAITRMCEDMAGKGHNTTVRKELSESRIQRDEADVLKTMEVISSMVDPFSYDNEAVEEIIHLSSGVVSSEEVTLDLLKAEEIGEKAFINFCQDRLQGDGNLNDSIPRKKLKTFTDLSKKVTTKVKGSEITIKSDRDLFARLVIIGKARKIDLRNMLTYSLGVYPLAIATSSGCLIKTNKAKLLHALEKVGRKDDTDNVTAPKQSVWIVDGMAVLQQLDQKNILANFGLLAKKVINQLINLALQNHSRCIHFVTDTYPLQSIKNAERSKRAASGSNRIKLSGPHQQVPKQWKKFMSNSENKEQLIEFFCTEWSKYTNKDLKGVEVVIAHGSQCHSIVEGVPNEDNNQAQTVQVNVIQELFCDHEEADTRMLLHAQYVSQQHSGEIPVVIYSPDTDVFVVATALTKNIQAKLFFHTGRGDSKRTIGLQAVKESLGSDVTDALIGLHCITGCDTVSAFFMKGKVKPLKLIQDHPELVNGLKALGESFTVDENLLHIIECFVCKLYGHNNCNSVNEVRFSMFKQSNRIENTMPPNRDSLHKHVQRANFQARIYKQSLTQWQNLPSAKENGWKFDEYGNIEIDWMSLKPAPESIMELTYCECRKKGKNCCDPNADDKCCVSHGIRCTDLCLCKGCRNMDDLETDEEDDDRP